MAEHGEIRALLRQGARAQKRSARCSPGECERAAAGEVK
jgi:hypothetical protein